MDAAVAEIELNEGLGQPLGLAHEDVLVKQLLKWFKQEFFLWMDNPSCSQCGSRDTKSEGVQQPSPEEREHDASR